MQTAIEAHIQFAHRINFKWQFEAKIGKWYICDQVGLATNLIADVPLADFGLELPFEVDTVRKLDMGFNGSLHPLEESICANPIGIAGLAISLDDKVLLMHRAGHLSTYADVLGASAS